VDLAWNEREVETEEAMQKGLDWGVPVFEVSAKSDEMVFEAIQAGVTMALRIYEQYEKRKRNKNCVVM